MKYIVDKIRSDLKFDGLSGLLQLLGMLLHSSLGQNVQLLMGIQPALPIPFFSRCQCFPYGSKHCLRRYLTP